MILERLIIEQFRFHSNRLAQKERIANLNAGHKIIKVGGIVFINSCCTQVQSILYDIVTDATSQTVTCRYVIFFVIRNLRCNHPIILKEITSLGLNAKTSFFRTIITKAGTRQ